MSRWIPIDRFNGFDARTDFSLGYRKVHAAESKMDNDRGTLERAKWIPRRHRC